MLSNHLQFLSFYLKMITKFSNTVTFCGRGAYSMGKMRKHSCMSVCSAAACRRDSGLHSSASQGVPLLCDAAHTRGGAAGVRLKKGWLVCKYKCISLLLLLHGFLPGPVNSYRVCTHLTSECCLKFLLP